MHAMTYKVRGMFDVWIVSADGTRRQVLDKCPNRITNTGLNAFGLATNFARYLVVGSGSTEPTDNDTSLVSQVAQVALPNTGAAVLDSVNTAARTMTAVWTATFPIGAAAGNLTEVGIGYNPTELSTRALFRDSSNNPVTIQVGANDQLVVTYYVVVQFPDTVVTTITDPETGVQYTVSLAPGPVVNDQISGFGFNARRQAAWYPTSTLFRGAATVFGGPMEAPSGGNPVNVGSNEVAVTERPYVNGSYECIADVSLRLGYAFNDVSVVALRSSAYVGNQWKIKFEPMWSKTTLQTVDFTVVSRWARG